MTTTSRGYGSHHQRVRQSWTPLVNAGCVTCWRCGHTITPGTPWDLGHDDHDRTRYQGPEHRLCNRRAGALKGNRSPKRRKAATWRPTPPRLTDLQW